VAAFDAVAESRPDLSLVIVGGPGWGLSEIDRSIASSRYVNRIVRTGYVPDGAVPAVLRRAAVVAYPSIEEGFGLPALEALACGAPLVTTTGTAMAEVSAGAALLVDAGDRAALAAALEAQLDGGAEVDARRRRGLERAAGYTWEACAEQHVTVYRWAVEAGTDGASGVGADDR